MKSRQASLVSLVGFAVSALLVAVVVLRAHAWSPLGLLRAMLPSQGDSWDAILPGILHGSVIVGAVWVGVLLIRAGRATKGGDAHSALHVGIGFSAACIGLELMAWIARLFARVQFMSQTYGGDWAGPQAYEGELLYALFSAWPHVLVCAFLVTVVAGSSLVAAPRWKGDE